MAGFHGVRIQRCFVVSWLIHVVFPRHHSVYLFLPFGNAWHCIYRRGVVVVAATTCVGGCEEFWLMVAWLERVCVVFCFYLWSLMLYMLHWIFQFSVSYYCFFSTGTRGVPFKECVHCHVRCFAAESDLPPHPGWQWQMKVYLIRDSLLKMSKILLVTSQHPGVGG